MATNTTGWPGFAEDGAGFSTDTDGDTTSVAIQVLNAFGIPYTGSAGGSLADVDIKSMDAMAAIKASLIEDLAKTGTYYEAIAGTDGSVEFVKLGSSGNITDRYYSLSSVTYKTDVGGVLVTGGKPLPTRWTREWHDPTLTANGGFLWSAVDLVDNCSKPNLMRHVVKSYNDPHLDSSYNDGIDNLYEINSPFEKIVGYAYNIDPGDIPEEATIKFSNTAVVPIPVSGPVLPILGTLQQPPSTVSNLSCYNGWGVDVNIDGAIKFVIPVNLRYTTLRDTVYDRFISVDGIYVVGISCEFLGGLPKDQKAAKDGSTADNTVIFAHVANPSKHVIQLKDGVNFGTKYVSSEGALYVKFVDRSYSSIKCEFGDEKTVYISSMCPWVTTFNGATKLEGVSALSLDGGRGILVSQVWAMVTLDMPSISIFDPRSPLDNDTVGIANNLVFKVAPLGMTDEPAPVAFNGTSINLADKYQDHDPTTSQNFEDTEYELVLKAMEGGSGITLSVSSLDASECETLSGAIYDMMYADNGTKTTHICGPNCEPQLGGAGLSGGIINSITYSYSDKGAYTVSVEEGPMFIGGLGDITGGPSVKMTEDVSATGTVLQDQGNHVMFKVLVDGIGVREAINSSSAIIRTGDKVNVTIHNNPVEA